MGNEELNTKLYEKMSAEQDRFRDRLLTQPPEKILESAYEYTVREDIVEEMSVLDLSGEQAAALLKSETPVADIYEAFKNVDIDQMTVIRECIEGRADTVIQHEKAEMEALRNAPLYKYPASHARENGELDAYRASHKANVACKEAIEQAIFDHYADNRLDSAAVKQVTEVFGYDRTLYVLANSIRQKDWDGRISDANKRWASTILVYKDPDGFGSNRNTDFVVGRVHPGLLDLFAAQARHEHLLSLPLTRENIKAEALNILSQFQNAREPNSPSGTHFIAQVSPDFLARAKDKDRERMMNMLPFESLALCSLDGRTGTYATIRADENRFQKLRLRKPSIRAQLAATQAEAPGKPAEKTKGREEAR